jgi:hypothetical protein
LSDKWQGTGVLLAAAVAVLGMAWLLFRPTLATPQDAFFKILADDGSRRGRRRQEGNAANVTCVE